jgi:hypothetical protein
MLECEAVIILVFRTMISEAISLVSPHEAFSQALDGAVSGGEMTFFSFLTCMNGIDLCLSFYNYDRSFYLFTSLRKAHCWGLWLSYWRQVSSR